MERKVDEIFKDGNISLKVVQKYGCLGCFYDEPCQNCKADKDNITGQCHAGLRNDLISIQFIPVMHSLNPEEIYKAHLKYLQEGKMLRKPEGKRFNSQHEIAKYLHSGGILPELWETVALKTQSNFQLIGLYSLLSFESLAAEAKFKKSFIATVELFLKY